MMDDRGVSEVVGFVLVFSLVTMTIAIVFTAGFGGLQDAQGVEQVNNVERAFDVFDHNAEDLYHRNAPSRATEIRLKGGQLQFGEPVTVTLSQGEESVPIYPTPVVYEAEGTKIAYEGGATIREEGGSSVMLNDPAFVVNENHTSLLIVRTQATGGRSSISGDRMVLIRAAYASDPRITTYHADPDEPIKVTIETPRVDAWIQYFERLEQQGAGEISDHTGHEVTFAFSDDTEQVSIVRSRLDVRLST